MPFIYIFTSCKIISFNFESCRNDKITWARDVSEILGHLSNTSWYAFESTQLKPSLLTSIISRKHCSQNSQQRVKSEWQAGEEKERENLSQYEHKRENLTYHTTQKQIMSSGDIVTDM